MMCLVAASASGAFCAILRGERHGRLQRLARLGEPVHQTQLASARRREVVAGQRDLHGRVVRDPCGSRNRPPAPATRPRLTSGRPNLASSEATIRSQASASSQPPARAYPSMAAMIGLVGGRSVMPPKPRPSHDRVVAASGSP